MKFTRLFMMAFACGGVALISASGVQAEEKKFSYGNVEEERMPGSQAGAIPSYDLFGWGKKTQAQTKAEPTTPAEAAKVEPAAAAMGAGDMPFNARPGECYSKVVIPAVTRTESDRVLVKAAGKKIARIIPAQYKMVTDQVVIKEQTEKLVTIPAVYKTVTETVVVAPESKKLKTVAAKYKTVTEKIMVRPARTVWKKGRGPNQRVDEATGEIMCLIEEPAVYKTVEKRVMVTPEGTTTQTIPAKTQMIKKRVVATPARVEKKMIPAVTKMVKKRVMVSPERVEYAETSPVYKTVNREVVVRNEKMEWSRILCNTNANVNTVRELQMALRNAGYNPGPIDGVLGPQTYRAVDKYQRAHDMSRGNITMEAMKALGVSL